ncbi:MAG: N-acetyl-gamma-glutamyl-phosphate reductase [Deltaproteobacteria bacterium]|nr:N-acetyl-gamma-glutamyl-phosphate reductase [Deltaproteobacteria bacterium]
MIKIAILGASGYTGLELMRLLAGHGSAQIKAVTSRQYKGQKVSSAFPFLKGFYDDLVFAERFDPKALEADLVFSALPHGTAIEAVSSALGAGKRVIDLSADFRFKDPRTYEQWYEPHTAKKLLKEAIYGLPEINRRLIKKARLVANPGCYPTGAILGLLPLVKDGLVEHDSIIIDSKSGISGAGRAASLATSFVEVCAGFKPYKVVSHRHMPEIEERLSIAGNRKITVTFTPHLLPVSRGILSTMYVRLKKDRDIKDLYLGSYEDEPFVRVLEDGFPDIAHVRCSNFCDIGIWQKGKQAIIVSAIDNLVKGASGQAIQNMNIIFNIKETEGLSAAPTPF